MACYKDGKYIDYLEGLLKPKERQSFEAHLSLCAHCQKILQESEITLGYVKGMKVELPSEDYWPIFYRGISRRIQERKAAPSYHLWGWLRWLAAKPALAAALALIAVSLFIIKLVFFPSPPASPPQEMAQIKDWGEKLTVGDMEELFNRRSPEDELNALPREYREAAAMKLLQMAEKREKETAPVPPAVIMEEEDSFIPSTLEDEIDRLSPEERIWLEKRLKESA